MPFEFDQSRERERRVDQSPRPASRPEDPYAHVLALQRGAGNQAVARLLAGERPSGPAARTIQRDIKDSKALPQGTFEIDFKKADASAADDFATEDGTVKFTPNASATESDAIRFVQIARTEDVAAGGELHWEDEEAPRNQQQTTSSVADKALTGAAVGGAVGGPVGAIGGAIGGALEGAMNPVEPGFNVDQQAGSLSQRRKAADRTVQPYYDATGPPIAGNQIGRKKGASIVPAVLEDHPGSGSALRFTFETSAKDQGSGTWYGSVHWGFETYVDKGVARIKGEHQSFVEGHSPTMDAAITKFDEYYKNPGASTAPKA